MTDNGRKTTVYDELKAGKNVMFFTVGVSMRPLLTERETHVMITPTDAPKKNDITLFMRPDGSYVLHRCMKVMNGYCLIRGDNTYSYERVEYSDILGVATHIYRRGKLIDVEKSRAYRAYVAFWNAIYPIRAFAVRARGRVSRWIKKKDN